MCIDVRMNMYIDKYVDMYADMCIVDMYTHACRKCTETHMEDVSKHAYRRVYRDTWTCMLGGMPWHVGGRVRQGANLYGPDWKDGRSATIA